MKLKSCSIGVGIPRATRPKRRVTRGEEGMSHRTLKYSRWREGYEEIESVIIGKFLIWSSLLPSCLMIDNNFISCIDEKMT